MALVLKKRQERKAARLARLLVALDDSARDVLSRRRSVPRPAVVRFDVTRREVRLARGSAGVEPAVLPPGRKRVGVRTRAARLETLLGADETLQPAQYPSHWLSAAVGPRRLRGRSPAARP